MPCDVRGDRRNVLAEASEVVDRKVEHEISLHIFTLANPTGSLIILVIPKYVGVSPQARRLLTP